MRDAVRSVQSEPILEYERTINPEVVLPSKQIRKDNLQKVTRLNNCRKIERLRIPRPWTGALPVLVRIIPRLP